MAVKPRENTSVDSRGASRQKVRPLVALQSWLIRHAQTFFYALGQLSRKPMATLMTTAVIGIALALPTGMHVMIQNAQKVLSGWEGATQVSLFLHHNTSEEEARELTGQLKRHPEINKVTYISRKQALEEFRMLSGFGDALDALEDNPLPAVIVVRPVLAASSPAQVESLVKELGKMAEVDMAQLDMEWLQRLYALMDIGKRAVWVLSALLGMAVLLVVGNTIRLMIQNQRDEIIITKLIGGTDAFIRRPFLYSGFWYGLFGAFIALLLVFTSLSLLQGPIQRLAMLYQSEFRLAQMDVSTLAGLIVLGALLGLIGSWLAVGRHLRAIEPS